MRKKVAVVIPACQEEGFIDKCLDSISLQTMDPSDIGCVVVDNGSTDRTTAIVRNYPSGYELITESYGYRLGASRTRNIGAKIALERFDPELMVFCDADTTLSPNLLETAHAVISGKYVGGTPRIFYDAGLCKNPIEYFEVKAQELINNLFLAWYHNVVRFPFPGYTPVMLADSGYVKKRLSERRYLFDPNVQMGEELIFQKELGEYGRSVFITDATATTSTRRWRKQGSLKIFLHGVLGQFYKGQPWDVEGRIIDK